MNVYLVMMVTDELMTEVDRVCATEELAKEAVQELLGCVDSAWVEKRTVIDA